MLLGLLTKRICKNCEFYDPINDPNYHSGDCKCPSLDIEKKESLVFAGATDDYGAYFGVRANFGCIMFKKKN